MSGCSVALAFVYVFVRSCIFFHPRSSQAISVSFEPSSARAVLLANDTELSVAPKTRRQQKSEKKHLVSGETPVAKSDLSTTSIAGRPSHSVLLRVLPASVFSHHLPSPSIFASVIYVSEQMLSVARLEGSLPSDPNITLIADVKRLDPPTDPVSTANLPPSDATAVAKVLNPGEAAKREDVKEEQSKASHVGVIGLDSMPEGQMIVLGVDGVEDWDVVRQVLSTGKRSGRAYDRLYRLTVSGDPESTKAAQDIPSPPASPCVC